MENNEHQIPLISQYLKPETINETRNIKSTRKSNLYPKNTNKHRTKSQQHQHKGNKEKNKIKFHNQTSIKPEKQGFFLRLINGLKEPKEKLLPDSLLTVTYPE